MPFSILYKLITFIYIILPSIRNMVICCFTINNGINYGVNLNKKLKNEEYRITNKFEIYRVMATLVGIIRQYMKLHSKINCYIFTDTNESTNKVKLTLCNQYLSFVVNIKKILSDKLTKSLSKNRVLTFQHNFC